MENRFWEIDFARGIAVLAMIVFHALFDLNYFTGYSFNLAGGFWWWFARVTSAAFVLLVGVGLHLSYSRSIQRGFALVAKKFLLRGAKIFSLGLLITLATYVFLEGKGTIWFGVLHFIGVSIILSLPFVSRPKTALLLAVVAILLGVYLDGLVVQSPYFFWLGLKNSSFYSFDYFPIFPWLGVMLLGIYAASVLYANGKRAFRIDETKNHFVELFSLAGRNSLLIYFFHQPILIALVLAAKSMNFG